MANLKAILRRLNSVKNTQKITRAMKMVAAAKLRRAQERVTTFRDFSDLTSSILAEVAQGATEKDHPLLTRREVKKSLVLVISSDRGLCGAFNGNLNREVFKVLEESESDASIAIIGSKAADYFARRPVNIVEQYRDVYESPGYETAARIARELAEKYASGEVDKIELAYNEFVSVMTQRVKLSQLLPVVLPEKGSDEPEEAVKLGPVGYTFEPDRASLLATLVPRYVEVQVYRALVESMAAEHAARMTAMDAATNNAGEMIDHLTLEYNRARQSAITNELMDIVGGAEALSD